MSFLILKFIQTLKKLLKGYQAFLSYLGLKFSQFQPQKDIFLLGQFSKVISLAKFESRISNCQLKIH